ncbi:hypothetical protein HRbin24_01596 [bacterium HR24]|jgi:Flp pilus assembly pilin Flp|nr:hypothetical protein HRbin24_01596 [bacterium HR24]
MKREDGQALSEYALVLALVVLGVLVAVRALGVRLDDVWAAVVAAWSAVVP